MSSFQKEQYGKVGGSNFTVEEPNKNHFSQVNKVNINSDVMLIVCTLDMMSLKWHFTSVVFLLKIYQCSLIMRKISIEGQSIKYLCSTLQNYQGCLFILFMVSFAVQNLLNFIRSHLFNFFLNFHYSRRWVKKDLAVIYVIECSSYVFL